MADWLTVRYDPTYEEPLDEELIPLLDALNAAGFVTISSCSGHGRSWPHIWFEHSTDERIERLVRFVKRFEEGDYRAHFTMWTKEILLEANALTNGHAYAWMVELHLNNVFGGDTPPTSAAFMLAEAVKAVNLTARRVAEFGALDRLCADA